MIGADRRKRRARGAEINMAPLLDMMFILLIFLMVTSHFSRESGLEIEKPLARTGSPQGRDSVLVALQRDGGVRMGGRAVSQQTLEQTVREALSETPGSPVMIVADRRALTEHLVKVYDRCRMAGAQKILVATREE